MILTENLELHQRIKAMGGGGDVQTTQKGIVSLLFTSLKYDGLLKQK